MLRISLPLILCAVYVSAADLPTLYDHYTAGGIKSGLVAEGNHFTLNGKPITIISGSFHYFRVHHEKWRHTLLKMKAAGLNAVQFYTAWNLHEEFPGHFDFETGFLNFADFLKAIKEADMFAVFRPGPYICAEWEFGGLPAWLLRDTNVKLRTNYKPYVDAIDRYFAKLIGGIAKNYQFTKGGPIIAMQIENEYSNGGNTVKNTGDAQYIKDLISIAKKNGMVELLFTSDPSLSTSGTVPELLQTVNFGDGAANTLRGLRSLHPNRPTYVAEFWAGWFDSPGGKHDGKTLSSFANNFEQILFQSNSSFNMYMFIGGTNFGFMQSWGHVTSYDYDAPLSEAGNYTDKYWKTKELIEKFNKERNQPKLRQPAVPKADLAAHYGIVKMTDYLSLDDLLKHTTGYKSQNPLHPEFLNIGPNYGQNWGFTNYRTKIAKSKTLTFNGDNIRDRGGIIIDGTQIKTTDVISKTTDISIPTTAFTNSGNEHTVDVLVENMGRVNGGYMNNERKGLYNDVKVDGKVQHNWEIFPLDFNKKFMESIKTEKFRSIANFQGPSLYRGHFEIKDDPRDTYVRLDDWHTSVVFVNGFNLGRYMSIGPAKTLYVPSPVLKKGQNEVLVFETYAAGNHVEFSDKPQLSH